MTGSSFSVATTAFVSLAICAIISYGVFYYFKQRLAVIEQSQMEQARILQAIISRGLAQQGQQSQQSQQSQQIQQIQQGQQAHHYDKEITITQNGLIEVSSDDESESGSDSASSDSESSYSESDSEIKGSDKWSIGDEIHQADGYFEECDEKFKKNILLDAICIDGIYVVESINIRHEHENNEENVSNKKIISLNKGALGTNDDENDADADDDDKDADANASGDDESSSSSSSSDDEEVQYNANVHDPDLDLNLKIGYKHKKEPLHLNYGNMSVPALRQLAKERGLGGEDADLQKLKKKNLVQLLQ